MGKEQALSRTSDDVIKWDCLCVLTHANTYRKTHAYLGPYHESGFVYVFFELLGTADPVQELVDLHDEYCVRAGGNGGGERGERGPRIQSKPTGGQVERNAGRQTDRQRNQHNV